MGPPFLPPLVCQQYFSSSSAPCVLRVVSCSIVPSSRTRLSDLLVTSYTNQDYTGRVEHTCANKILTVQMCLHTIGSAAGYSMATSKSE